MGKLYYFQTPTFDINPESEAAPKLGSIFATLETLTAPLNQFEHVRPPTSLVNESSSADFEETAGSSLRVTVTYGAGRGSGDPIYAFASDKKNVYSCKLLETVEFSPTAEFVTECIRSSQQVQRFLESAFVGRKRVYMVTGLKIAAGFSTSSTGETQHNPKQKINVGATPTGVPTLLGGPELDIAMSPGRTLAHGLTANKIVVAYRVIRVKVKWDGEAQYKCMSGGKYRTDSSDEDSDDDDKSGGKKDQWDLEPLDEGDIAREFPDAVKIDVEESTNVEANV
ncbi:hypothetical protein JDV02_010343 [Purpureocillium takamizusanense]|uniref:Uncharacterized protein n=1 Tax=Purpureocillium takamizusanense TaxID=2060973 RepID=A0A9Q8QS15_9HYPO|nr:uncharacterized protein JDV02_010343 [Purpureocillium takamizusanense]UNI24608.1 hypothetical protein JDV02_010343 [Purpureocillium takamizusanense]